MEIKDSAKYQMISNFSFSVDEFDQIKKGYDRVSSMDQRWSIFTENYTVNICRSWQPRIVFKIPFELWGENYHSTSALSSFNTNSQKLTNKILKQNYRNYWIYSLISQLIFKEPPLIGLDTLVFKSQIDYNSVHGFKHWRSVYRTGKSLSKDIDINVLFYFSVFHDFFRQNDYTDEDHGKRAYEIMRKQILNLDDTQMEKLGFAMHHHDLLPEEYYKLDNPIKNDKTVQVCIDSDRLDLGRVGVTTLSEYLLTEEARYYNNKVNTA